jgi:hypothetical protein
VGFDWNSTENDVRLLAPTPATTNCRESSEGGIVKSGTMGPATPTGNGPATERR